MKYNDYNGYYKWVALDLYECQKCKKKIETHRRIRHIGEHLRNKKKN